MQNGVQPTLFLSPEERQQRDDHLRRKAHADTLQMWLNTLYLTGVRRSIQQVLVERLRRDRSKVVKDLERSRADSEAAIEVIVRITNADRAPTVDDIAPAIKAEILQSEIDECRRRMFELEVHAQVQDHWKRQLGRDVDAEIRNINEDMADTKVATDVLNQLIAELQASLADAPDPPEHSSHLN
jgi:hypothetical protein